MNSYSIVQWLFFFYFYCFFGWCFESAYVSLKSRRFVNRGFMRGPYLPIYGSGAIMMLIVSMPFRSSLIMTYISGCIGATILEYVTGVTMEKLFKVKYWDYSDQKFNFQGHICLSSTLAWGGLTILMTGLVHKWVETAVLMIPGGFLTVLTYILTVIIGADFALSFKAAMDLRDVLVKMEKAKLELIHIQKRLDVIIAIAGEDLSNYRTEISENMHIKKEAFTENMETRMDDLRQSIEEKMLKLKEIAIDKPGEHWENAKSEYHELYDKYYHYMEERRSLGAMKDFFQKDLIRSNPSMSSERFKEALEEIKQKLFSGNE